MNQVEFENWESREQRDNFSKAAAEHAIELLTVDNISVSKPDYFVDIDEEGTCTFEQFMKLQKYVRFSINMSSVEDLIKSYALVIHVVDYDFYDFYNMLKEKIPTLYFKTEHYSDGTSNGCYAGIGCFIYKDIYYIDPEICIEGVEDQRGVDKCLEVLNGFINDPHVQNELAKLEK